MPFTRHAVAMFISEKITQVTECNAIDVSLEFPSAKNWISSFGLMLIFVNQPRENVRPFALQFLRRTEMAIAEYAQACAELHELVSGDRGRWSPYFRALYHFETAISQLYQAYDYARKQLSKNYFKSGDRSPLDRLNKIHSTVKHTVAIQDQPVWITNTGIETTETCISFAELEDMLRSDAKIAMQLTTTSNETKADA